MITRRLCLQLFSLIFFSVCSFIAPTIAQSLYFDPDPFIPQDYVFSVPLVLESGGLEVKGVEAIISFDPTLVSLDSITPGPWYTDSGQDFFFWDHTTLGTGSIHFSSAMLQGTSNDDGIIAYCNFSFVDFGTSFLDFGLVDIRNVENDALPFGSDNGLIILGNAVDAKNITFSAIKAIYQ